MIATMTPTAPNACALLFLTSVQCGLIPHVHRKSVVLRSTSIGSLMGGEDMPMGNIWNDIEWTRRLLDETRIEMLSIIERQKKLNGRDSVGEYESLEKKFNDLIKREDELRAQLARLITVALRQQMRGGGRPYPHA